MSLGAPVEDLYRMADQADGVMPPSPEVMPEPGLAGLDVPTAAQGVANAGTLPPAPGPEYGPPAPVSGEAAPAAAAPTIEEAPAPEPMTPDALEVPTPTAPLLTGDPAKDQMANLQYQRDLATHYGKREQEIARRAQGANAKKAAQELAVAKAAEVDRQKLRAEQLARRSEMQKHVDDSVAHRVAAQQELEGANWQDKHTGRALVATIFGALGQGLKDVAMIQSGHAPTAENEAVKTINGLIQRDYEQKKAKLMGASESLLEARHGYSDLVENQRAALNDLDADTSAKYKLVEKEAENRLRQLGASPDDIKENALVQNAQQMAAKAEGTVLDREETHRDARERAAATAKMAEAHLGLQERTAAATEALGRANLGERRAEFGAREADRREHLGDKEKAAAEKHAEDLEKRAYRDPDTGELKGYAGTTKVAQKVTDQTIAARAYSQSLRDLAEDIEKNGHVGSGSGVLGTGIGSTEAGKHREELHAAAVARGRKALDLGVSNANLQLEHSSVGGSGAGFHGMGSPKVLREIADKNDAIADQRVRSSISSPTDQEKGNARPPAVPPRAAPAPAAKPQIMRLGTIEYHLQPDGTYK